MRLMPPEWRAVASTVPPSAPSAPDGDCAASSRALPSHVRIMRMKAINHTSGIEAMLRYLLSPHRWAKRPSQHRRRRRLAGQLQADPLSPKIATVSMSGRFAVVAINALRVLRGKLADIKTPGLPCPPVAVSNVTEGAPA